MTTVLDVPRSGEDCGSDKKGEAPADPPPPEKYIEATLAAEEDGRTLLILSPTVKEGQAEKES
eukprot:5777885-Pleurochrysis_carterae.AAC.1